MIKEFQHGFVALILGALSFQLVQADQRVTVDNFSRAETARTMADYVKLVGFGEFYHIRKPAPIDQQKIVRLNLHTLYSFGVFDLSSPVTITLPDSGERFMSALIINQDHSMLPVEYAPGEFTVTQEKMGTRYVIIALRAFMGSPIMQPSRQTSRYRKLCAFGPFPGSTARPVRSKNKSQGFPRHPRALCLILFDFVLAPAALSPINIRGQISGEGAAVSTPMQLAQFANPLRVVQPTQNRQPCL